MYSFLFRNRWIALFFAISMIVSAIAIVPQAAKIAEAKQTSAPVDTQAKAPSFDEWANSDSGENDGRGKVIGHVERNGELIEVRELPAAEDPERADDPTSEMPLDPNPAQ